MKNSMHSNILILDDNKQILESLSLFLERHFGKVHTLRSPNTLNSFMQNNEIDLILLDMNFTPGQQTGNEGLFWLKEVSEKHPEVVVVLITAYGDVELAIEGIKRGAYDFILKPWDNNKLVVTISAALKFAKSKRKLADLESESQALKEQLLEEHSYVICESNAMKKIYADLKKSAVTDANILILGENGTGKEVIAKEIHRLSARSKKGFFHVDIASLNESLFESELFGHEKGAFTDAKEQRIGKIEAASGGTLFLDEIGNLPFNLQAKLLQVIQNKVIFRVGSEKAQKVDFRLVSATNKPLIKQVKDGTFREDLFFRINTVVIELPPLRERKEDIAPLAEGFLTYYCKKYDKRNLKLSVSGYKKLEGYNWPGNIRELKHTIERAVIFADSNKLSAEDFSFPLIEANQNVSIVYNLAEVERKTIAKAIVKCNGNMSQAAEILGISRNTLYAKVAKYEI